MSHEIEERCPFCASRSLSVESYSTGVKRVFYVNCMSCGADGPAGESRSEAVSKWNARPTRGDGQ